MGLSVARMENSFMNSGLMKKLTTPTSSSAIATVALLSNLTKDALNCYYYVTQSLHNKKIPEDKRKFVAGLDLSNGILNVVTQTLLGTQVIKWSDKIFERYISPKFYANKAVESAAKNLRNNSLEAIKEAFTFKKNYAKCGMKVIATLVATQVICKRIIVPLIATPMASYFRKKFENAEKNKSCSHIAQPTKDTITFENSAQNATVAKHENFPKCFQSFMK